MDVTPLPDSTAAYPQDQSMAWEPIGSLDEVFDDLGQGSDAVAGVLAQLKTAILTKTGCEAATQAIVSQAAKVPYFDLGDYMGRTWLREKREGMQYAARVHKIMRSDHDRACHDHPWMNASIVLSDGYWEVQPGLFQACIEKNFYGRWTGPAGIAEPADETINLVLWLNKLIQAHPASRLLDEHVKWLADAQVHWRGPMDVIRRHAESLHRLVIPQGTQAWSLFIMRPKIREWGFLGFDGWEHNVPYLQKFGRDA